MEKETFGSKIWKLRKNRGLTQQDIADMLYVSNRTVSKWETDKSVPDIATIKKLAEIYEVSIDVLLSDVPTEVGKPKVALKTKFNKIVNSIFKKKIKYLRMILIVLLLTFVIANINFVEVYSIKNGDVPITVENGYFIKSKIKNILALDDITILDIDYDIVNIKTTLYTIVNGDKVYLYKGDTLDAIFIEELYGYNEIFTNEVIEAMDKALYLNVDIIDTDAKYHNYETKLNFNLNFSNHYLFYKKQHNLIDETDNKNKGIKLDELTLIENDFEKDEEMDMYKKEMDDMMIYVDLKNDKIIINQEKKNTICVYHLDLVKENLNTKICDKNMNVIIKYNYEIESDKLTCYKGDCNSYKEDWNFVSELLKSFE